MRKTDFTPIRIHTATRKRLDRLIKTIVQVGWKSVGTERDDAPGIASVIDEGLALLDAKLKGAK